MARTSDPHSATSEFYINHTDNFSLDYGEIAYGGQTAYYKVGYCVFGKVVSGMDVVDAIAVVNTTTENNMDDVPVNDIIIQSATITLDEPVCIEKLEGDVDGDCDVDLVDFSLLAGTWLMENSTPYTANFNSDDAVDMVDFVIFSKAWAKSDGDTGFNAACDLNFDGSIDEWDLLMFTSHWLD